MDDSFAGNSIAFTIPVQLVNADPSIVTDMEPEVNDIPSIPEQLLNAFSLITDRDAGNVMVPVMKLQYLKACFPIVNEGAVETSKLRPVILTLCAFVEQLKAPSSINEMVAGKFRSELRPIQL